MVDRYAVIGQPVAHSRSPFIHAAFAVQTGQALTYERVEGVVTGFEAQVHALAAGGLRGMNVTLPFKDRALALAQATAAAGGQTSLAAALAGAANTLWFEGAAIHADNTDGVGLLRDLERRLQVPLAGRRILVLGAGGAVRGILPPLLQRLPACLHLVNRTHARAEALVASFGAGLCAQPRLAHLLASAGTALAAFEAQVEAARSAGALRVRAHDALDGRDGVAAGVPYDLIINGTSGGLSGAALALPTCLFAPHTIAYDLAYRADGDTVFMQQARSAGAQSVHDGLGMLVEQAAESFLRWRGVLPQTAPVLAGLRSALRTPVRAD